MLTKLRVGAGGVAEWLKAPVLKTGSPKRARGFEGPLETVGALSEIHHDITIPGARVQRADGVPRSLEREEGGRLGTRGIVAAVWGDSEGRAGRLACIHDARRRITRAATVGACEEREGEETRREACRDVVTALAIHSRVMTRDSTRRVDYFNRHFGRRRLR